MARIRTIKPEFWSSPSMRGANPWARLLFVAMWNWADDTGRGTANVRELAAFAFPDEEDLIAPTVAELPSLLAVVRDRWDVTFYEVGGRRYYAIPARSWEAHQRTERRAKSRHPAPDEGSPYDPDPDGGNARKFRRSVAEGSARSTEGSNSPPQSPEWPTDSAPVDGSQNGSPVPGRKEAKTGPDQGVAEVPTHCDGSSDATHGSSGPGTGEQGNRGTGEKNPRGRETKPPTSRETKITPAVLANSAHSIAAHHLVEDYAAKCARRPPATVLARLAVEIDALIDQDWPAIDIARALAAWQAKGLDPRALHSVANEVINGPPRDPSGKPTLRLIDTRPVEDIPDAEIDPDAILGPDGWSPVNDEPLEVSELPYEQRSAWLRARSDEHRAERIRQARTALARRQRNRGTA